MPASRMIVWVIVLSVASLAGCYESKTPLGPAENGIVNPAILGTWICRSPDTDANKEDIATLRIIAFDASRYYLEWVEDDKTTRYAAHSSSVGKALLHNVRELKKDGRGDAKWEFVRVQSPGESELQVDLVKDEDFHLKKIGEAEALREIRERVNEDALYYPFAKCLRPS